MCVSAIAHTLLCRARWRACGTGIHGRCVSCDQDWIRVVSSVLTCTCRVRDRDPCVSINNGTVVPVAFRSVYLNESRIIRPDLGDLGLIQRESALEGG